MKILFLDQSGKLGGAELSLLDVATYYRDNALVGLFQDGSFRENLEARQIPVQILTTDTLKVRKDSNLLQAFSSVGQLIPLVNRVTKLSRKYDVIYTNTPKAFIIGALASYRSGRPLVYHLRDIISAEHFSRLNRSLLITLANARCSLVIANSNATRKAFIQAGGNPDIVQVVYNGFSLEAYQTSEEDCQHIRQQLALDNKFVVGHFSRLSPWKGQHILIEALQYCAEHVVVLLVGDALFGEDSYVKQLHQQVEKLGLQDRVKFLGFRNDIPTLMGASDLIAHTSTAPEPFGRVIIEAMLCGTPVVAAAAGGATELVDHEVNGWLSPSKDVSALTNVIMHCCNQPDSVSKIAHQAQKYAEEEFSLTKTNPQIEQLLHSTIHCTK